MVQLSRVSSDALLVGLRALVGRGRVVEAEMLGYIGEVDARRVYLREGCASMFRYCVEVLHFSESAAFKRITAARAGRKFPELLSAVREGDLHVTAVGLIAPHLDKGNLSEWIALARHRTKAEIMNSVRRQAAPSQVNPPPPQPTQTEQPLLSPPQQPTIVAPSPPAPLPISRPHDTDRSTAIRFTATPEVHRQLRELTALLRHQIPDGDPAQILAFAVDRLHKHVRKQKFGECDRPRSAAARSSKPSRKIPAAIRRAVSKRDGERCAYVSPTGRRCTSREFLEFHHLIPWARRRAHEVENVALRCRAHNFYEAERDFGTEQMARFRKAAGSEPSPTRSGAS